MNTTEPTFVNAKTKATRLMGLFDKVLTSEEKDTQSSLDILIEDMLQKDPKLLCRLNFKNPEVKKRLKNLIDTGRITIADLMYDPADTLQIAPTKVRKAKRIKNKSLGRETRRITVHNKPRRARQQVCVDANYDSWLDELDRQWKRESSESGVFEAILA